MRHRRRVALKSRILIILFDDSRFEAKLFEAPSHTLKVDSDGRLPSAKRN